MCPPKPPEVPEVQKAPEPAETAKEVKAQGTEERRENGKSKRGTLDSLRVDLNVPGSGGSSKTKTGANVPTG